MGHKWTGRKAKFLSTLMWVISRPSVGAWLSILKPFLQHSKEVCEGDAFDFLSPIEDFPMIDGIPIPIPGLAPIAFMSGNRQSS
jgi:hypothetical protein